MLLRLGDDGVDIRFVVEGEHAAQGVGTEVFDEGLGDGITVRDQQLLERDGVLEGASIRHLAR